jgi:acyl carrier protein
MDAETVRAVVLEALGEIAPEAELAGLDPARSFRDQIALDSIDFLNLMLALEASFGVRIEDIDYPKLSSLSGCIAYLAPRIAEKRPPL